jgi:hypothetical protein
VVCSGLTWRWLSTDTSNAAYSWTRTIIFVYGIDISPEGARLLVGMLLMRGGEGSDEAIDALMEAMHDSHQLTTLVPLTPRMKAAIHAVVRRDDAPEELLELRDKLGAETPPAEAR